MIINLSQHTVNPLYVNLEEIRSLTVHLKEPGEVSIYEGFVSITYKDGSRDTYELKHKDLINYQELENLIGE